MRGTDVTATADGFGAVVRTDSGGVGLFYVVGRAGAPDGAVTQVGGRVVARIGPHRVLATITHEAAPHLRRDHRVALAGQVTVDPRRFSRFLELAGHRPAVDQPTSKE